MAQADLDRTNADFWNELSGTWLARSLGITEFSPENLKRYDEAYLQFYPYLSRYVLTEELADKKVLEIGLGHGTLGQMLASEGCQYYGLDIARNPVAMMRYRLSQLGQDSVGERVREGSALAIPHKDGLFDYVYSVGCLHHTGNLRKAVSEVYRVLAPGGKAVIMLYNRHSLRQFRKKLSLVLRPRTGLLRWFDVDERARFGFRVRALYDINASGEAAPHTDFVSRSQVRALFCGFSQVWIESQNCDDFVLPPRRLVIPRARLLGTVGRLLGLDLYVRARK